MNAIVSNPDPSDELPAIEHTSVIQGSVRHCSLKRSCFTASEIFTKSSRKMNGCLCPCSGPLLKEGVDREVKAGENFKHPLAQGPPGSLQLTLEWKESRAKSKRSLAQWYTSIIISRSPPFFSIGRAGPHFILLYFGTACSTETSAAGSSTFTLSSLFKEKLHPKMRVLSLFFHPHVSRTQSGCFFSHGTQN